MPLGDFVFGGWFGWPVKAGDDLHKWEIIIQLWLAMYERQLAIFGTNDLPHTHFLTIDGVSIPIADNLTWLDDGAGNSSTPIVGSDAHSFWSGGFRHTHAQHGGTYPGTPVFDLDYSPFPDGEFDNVRWWIDGVWKSLRSIQEWIWAYMGEFCIPRIEGNYDYFTQYTYPDGSTTTDIPKFTFVKDFVDAAGIGYDIGDDGYSVDAFFTRQYPKEFQFRTPILYTTIFCDETTMVSTRAASTTYTDGSPFGEGDRARCIGNNIEDPDALTGILCDPSWIEWPDAWVYETGKVYQRTGGVWVEVDNPYGAAPDVVTAHGFIRRGDYLTPTLYNELYAGLNKLIWTTDGLSWTKTDAGGTDHDTHAESLDQNSNTYAGALAVAEASYLANVDQSGSLPHCWSHGSLGEFSGELDDFAAFDTRTSMYGLTTTPKGVTNEDPPYDYHTSEHPISCIVDYMNYAQKPISQVDDAHHSFIFDDNGDPVTLNTWRIFSMVGPSNDTPRTSDVTLGSSLGVPDPPPTPSGSFSNSFGTAYTQGYQIANAAVVRRFDVDGGMTFIVHGVGMIGRSSLTATLRGTGAMAATIPGTGSLTGVLDGSTGMIASISGSGSLSATLHGAGALASTINGTSTLTGTLPGRGALASTIAGTSTLTATLHGNGAFAATLSGTGTLTGTLSGDIAYGGSYDVIFGGTAAGETTLDYNGDPLDPRWVEAVLTLGAQILRGGAGDAYWIIALSGNEYFSALIATFPTPPAVAGDWTPSGVNGDNHVTLDLIIFTP